jgi:hypothetical protein
MDARKEIERCRRDAEDHEWTAKELRCRADALELRDSTYVRRRQEEGIPVEPEAPWLQRIGDFLGIEL